MNEMQELYCHECGGYVRFPIDTGLNGNHVVKCPECGHEHCRVVKDGVITDERWGQRNSNMQTYIVSNATYSPTSVGTSSAATSYNTTTGTTSTDRYLSAAWLNTIQT